MAVDDETSGRFRSFPDGRSSDRGCSGAFKGRCRMETAGGKLLGDAVGMVELSKADISSLRLDNR